MASIQLLARFLSASRLLSAYLFNRFAIPSSSTIARAIPLGECKARLHASMLKSGTALSKILFLYLLFSLAMSCSPEKPEAIEETATVIVPDASLVMKEFGPGFNLGNTFDLAMNSTELADAKLIIDLYYDAGYRHIRLPVTWMDGFNGDHLADQTGRINTAHARFVQFVAVIDYAIAKGLYVIINTHHEHWLKTNFDRSATYEQAFAALWTGIAEYFRSYSHRLVFQVLNEPEGAFGDFNSGADPFSTQSLNFTRRINQVGYDAIRATGGANLTRIVLIMPNGQGNQSLLDDVYPSKDLLPMKGDDRYLAISVHTYDPWAFCGQDGTNASWPGSAGIISAIDATAAHGIILGTPIHLGEFGVGRSANQTERDTDLVRNYYRTVSQIAARHGMPSTVWDDRGWFELVKKDSAGGYQFVYNIAPYSIVP